MEKRKMNRFWIKLPLQFWDTRNSLKRGLVGNVNETGLMIFSSEDLGVGTELRVRVDFSLGYDSESFEASGKILWKKYHYEGDWKRYKYGLKFIRISPEQEGKLKQLLFYLQSLIPTPRLYSPEERKPRQWAKGTLSESLKLIWK